jgi:hypothetical protein
MSGPRISPEAARKELARRKAAALKDKSAFDLKKFLFDKQLAFVTDLAKEAIACCSVRSGKTVACAADLINTALSCPNTVGFYITLARSSAKRIVWPTIKKIVKDFKLDAKCHQNDLSVEFANGSFIYLTGANTDNEVQKIRGMSRVAVIYVDECQAFRAHLKDLIDNVLTKRLYDLNGRLRLIGTPGPLLQGYFFELCHNKSWSQHAWTMFDNPWLPIQNGGFTAEMLTEQDCRRRGVTRSHPSIQRENYGIWVRDESSLLLNYNAEVNHFEGLPPGQYHYILGIDVGFDDADSLSVLAYSDMSPVTYLVEEVIVSGQLVGELALQIKKLDEKYKFREMIADTGGLGKKVIKTLIFQYSLVIEPADKVGKIADYGLLNNALRTGNFKAAHTTRFAQDCFIIQRDKNKSTPDKIVVDGHSDAVDSVLYAFAYSPAYDYVAPKLSTRPGSAEYYREQETLHKQAIMERMRREQANKDASAKGLSWEKGADGMDPWHKWEE